MNTDFFSSLLGCGLGTTITLRKPNFLSPRPFSPKAGYCANFSTQPAFTSKSVAYQPGQHGQVRKCLDSGVFRSRFMVENEIKRYRIGSVTEGLKRNHEGTLTIYISHKKPNDPVQLANWLPAPDGYFMLQVRLYEPEESIVKGEFKLPEMHRVE